MNLVVSIVVAVATVLSTIMLQLGDESGDAAFVCSTSFFATLAAVYFVDYKKSFSLPKWFCNVLLTAVVVAQVGTLARSRQEFLAFSIANILIYFAAILFFSRKTPRVYYQLLAISFVQVAVGCVFQRSPLFAILTPLYATAAFCGYSLLLLETERVEYGSRSTILPRFVRRKSPKGSDDASGFDEESPVRPTASGADGGNAKKRRFALFGSRKPAKTPQAVDRAFDAPVLAGSTTPFAIVRTVAVPAPTTVRFPTLTDGTRFASCISNDERARIGKEFFRRFAFASVAALAVAAAFFSLVPRPSGIEIGDFRFGRDGWQAGGGGAATVGFSETIELGELGSVASNPTRVATIRFVDPFDPKRPSTAVVDPRFPVYLRGSALVRYDSGVWGALSKTSARSTKDELSFAILVNSPSNPDDYLTDVDLSGDASFGTFDAPFGRRGRSQDRSSSVLWSTRTFAPEKLYYQRDPGDRDKNRYAALAKIPANRRDDFLFDARNALVGTEIELEKLDSPILFGIWPFYYPQDVRAHLTFDVDSIRRATGAARQTFALATNAFREGRQVALTPNQEQVSPFLDQYLAFDEARFPRLCELARRWDAESNLPKADFAGRAQYLESRLKYAGGFQYDRTGVRRDPSLDPLEDFVSVSKRGHCEYFAGALALMLRAVGIPSRTVVGFLVFPEEDGSPTVVRQSDAHSWVEAFVPASKFSASDSPAASLFPQTGPNGQTGIPAANRAWPRDGAWLRLDATPESSSTDKPGRIALTCASWSLFFQTLWRDYVLNFNGSTQQGKVYKPLVDAFRRAVAALRDFKNGFHPLRALSDAVRDLFDSAKTEGLTPLVVFRILSFAVRIALAALLVGWIVLRLRRKRLRRLAARPKKLRVRCDARTLALYERIEKALGDRTGVPRAPSETPREFLERSFEREDAAATRVAPVVRSEDAANAAAPSAVPVPPSADRPATSPETRRALREIVELYYRARFGGEPAPANEIARLTAATNEL